ncbi:MULTISPECIES: hypothetical protein [Salipiger]|uniref:Uncharacterized protein n=1 Tax=Salipiger profundus TaxID=1229727 RepID=A0A1U7CZG4_9RHOB|nr:MULTISPECIES: hypothetical protein [Salipiger]ALF02076.1 hypothetical protein vBThpSP1_037 [Thiobacimonas phage vB_ThpS-P1]APX21299.1 hypothetical protein Ga0080559_TMP503 [Salipiger profundus]GGA03427.1 hypothetical protein GCM10011326_13520 [Salipiger profundus]
MSVPEIDAPDDGTAKWAEEKAAGMIGVAMCRIDKERGPKDAAAFLATISSFAMSMIHENPRLSLARYEELLK